jgi:HlyD family secretion protein
MGHEMKRLRKWIWIPIVIVVLVAGVFGDAYYQQRQYQATLGALQTQALALGTITASVSATGTLAAVRTADLSFAANSCASAKSHCAVTSSGVSVVGTSGLVGQVDVKLGQAVKQGQVLAALDPASLPSDVNLAKQDLVSAQQALANAQSSQTAQANAELALANAQKAYNSALTTYTDEVADPKGALDAATSGLQTDQSYWQYLVDHNPGGVQAQARIKAAYTQVVQDMQQVQKLQNLYDTTGFSGLVPLTTTPEQVTAEYDLAKSQLADAQATLKNFQNGVNPQTVAAAQAQVAADEATIAEAEITAPFDGTITALNLQVGDVATPGVVVISMADVSQLHVDIPVSELDISTIQVGQSATLNFDAFPSKNYQGQVTAVSTKPAISSGSVTYAVRVVVGDADPSLLPGMTAGVTIVTSNLSNVLVVPSRAVRTVNGRQVVYEVQNSRLVPVSVTLGASNDTQTQVTGGVLRAGAVIVVNPPSTIPSASTGLFGIGRIFGGGAGGGGGPNIRFGGGFGGGG